MIQKIAEYTIQSDAVEVVMAAIAEFVGGFAEHEPRRPMRRIAAAIRFRPLTSGLAGW